MSRLEQLYALREQIDAEIRALERTCGVRPLELDVARRTVLLVAHRHGITADEMADTQIRRPRVVAARREAAVRLRRELGMSYPQIAKVLGYKDHTTVMHAIRRATRQLEAV